MSKVVINSFEDFQQYVGQELGVSDYVELDQERINLFADATMDHQWIHVDAEKAKQESPFGQTIAHGYLTLSMLPYLWDQIIEVNNLERMMNYGMDAMKFAQPVLSGQHICMKTKLQAAEICLNAGVQMAIALGEDPKVIHRIIDGEDEGTLFG